MNRPLKMKTAGILGGMTSQATIEYYQAINAGINSVYGGHEIAETIIIGVNFGNIEFYVRNDKWKEAKDYLQSKALQAQAAGADLLVCASNTMHKVLDDIEKIINIPFIHIMTPIISVAIKQNLKKVGLIGTIPVMKEDFLSQKLTKRGIDVIAPPNENMVEIDRILFDETSKGIVKDESIAFIKSTIKNLISKGAQGIVLACTELFLLVKENDFPDIQILDTTKLHIQEVVKTMTNDIE